LAAVPVLQPFRFGVAAHAVASAERWRDLARRAEDLGYATLILPDHLNPQLAPIPGLLAAALQTTTLRVAVQVLDVDHRNPVVAAKEVATLDLLSGGRCDWGMGAGWLHADYEATGIPFDPPGVRLSRLVEAVAVMKGLFAGGPVDHQGRHYTVRGAVGDPQPVQRPHPPLLVGGSRPRLLRFAGREADIVSISPSWDSRRIMGAEPSLTVEAAMDLQVGWIRDGAGDRFDRVELSHVAMPVEVTDDPGAAFERIAPNVGLTPDEARRSPHVLAGPVGAICDALVARRERWGLSNIVVPVGALEPFAPVVARLAGT
jgi:probable F420-dependent oxidoreductase